MVILENTFHNTKMRVNPRIKNEYGNYIISKSTYLRINNAMCGAYSCQCGRLNNFSIDRFYANGKNHYHLTVR
jgi:hypothetical protein